MSKRIKVVLAKPGLDGHDRGVKVVARSMAEAGMEVVYLGLQQTPEMIVKAALEEDADVIGLSILSGAHMTLFPRVKQLLEEHGAGDRLLTGGGIIPDQDVRRLAEMGIRVFGPGTSTREIIEYIEQWYRSRAA
jgi:methylmalonyl-CoA mutase C-terminal domain/subunit